ncbi:MAG: LacI family DNA-binding transcriptional regulator [Chloroflexi bacterium]|nr:LacI family DNA-binding transcriptional regulator [Chloroflexota bacterium]MBI3763978.1 LacI family DNA-binding transcriptional regulator [Chloroflexota bacterium]
MTTVKEVAKRAGVSTATVSRVLNDIPNVTPDARKRVQDAVQALNYRPSRVARRLRIKHTQVIGLIISDIQNLFFTSVTRGIEDIASRNGYSLILCNTDEDADRERVYLEVMHAENVAGIILASATETGHDPELLNGRIPVVALDRLITDVQLDTVLVDNVGGAETAVAHLLSHGHRRIGMISSQQQLTTAREREDGYGRALKEFGLPVEPSLIRKADVRQIADSRRQALDLLALPDRPTALFTFNNTTTLGTLTAIQERGLRIPDDVAVAAFDDLPWATLLDPPLTAVPQPTYELGKTAAEMLLARIANPHRPTTQNRLSLDLVVRESCGADHRPPDGVAQAV